MTKLQKTQLGTLVAELLGVARQNFGEAAKLANLIFLSCDMIGTIAPLRTNQRRITGGNIFSEMFRQTGDSIPTPD